MLGEQDAMGNLTHLVPSSAYTLQPAGYRRRGLHLDHQIHSTHIDAQFQAGGGHYGAQPPGLQIVFNERPLVLGYRAVMRLGQHVSRSGH